MSARSSRVGTIRSRPMRATCTRGQGAHQPPVALVRRQADRARLRDREVDAGDADVRGEEDLAHDPARRPRQILEPRARRRAGDPREEIGDVFGRLLDRGRDDVDGVLARELEDVLAEVGLDGADPDRLERFVQADLLGQHRLRLGHELRAGVLGDLDNLRRPRLQRSRTGARGLRAPRPRP